MVCVRVVWVYIESGRKYVYVTVEKTEWMDETEKNIKTIITVMDMVVII